jgi:hypothetical protein
MADPFIMGGISEVGMETLPMRLCSGTVIAGSPDRRIAGSAGDRAFASIGELLFS